MASRKGMSQILTIIVAASVLMMTGLTIIMMSQGALSGVFGTSNKQSCINTIKTNCQFSGSGPHSLPNSCVKAGISGSVPGVSAEVDLDNEQYTCTGS